MTEPSIGYSAQLYASALMAGWRQCHFCRGWFHRSEKGYGIDVAWCTKHRKYEWVLTGGPYAAAHIGWSPRYVLAVPVRVCRFCVDLHRPDLLVPWPRTWWLKRLLWLPGDIRNWWVDKMEDIGWRDGLF